MWHVWPLEPPSKKQKRVVRKRHRLAISCSRCRRLKVKCDRQTPCSHCIRSKRTEECTYVSHPSSSAKAKLIPSIQSAESSASATASSESPQLLPDLSLSSSCSPTTDPDLDNFQDVAILKDDISPMYSYPDKDAIWLSKFRGETHWAVYLKEFRSIFSPDNGHLEYPPLPSQDAGPDLRVGISNIGNLMDKPKEFILSIIPDREKIQSYVESYLSTVERIYPVLHKPTFQAEIDSFWKNEKTPRWDWLAQYLMVIGIGCLTTSSANNKQVQRLLRAAEVCLLQIAFILNPTILTINAIGMMVIAKHIGAMSCHEYDSCGPLMGIVIRHAMSIRLHCDPTFGATTDISPFQIEMRRRLWTTIVHLELQQAITSGMPPLLKIDDFNTMPPSNLDDDDLDPQRREDFIAAPSAVFTDSSFQILLASSFSAAFEVVTAANSLSGNISYEQLSSLDSRIRGLLSETFLLRSTLLEFSENAAPAWKTLQISTLEITFRRLLLTLHQRYARQPQASIRYPTSYWSALECSLAVLVRQRQIYEDLDHHESAKWFAELFKNDFFMAIMMVGIQLCRKDDSALDETGPTMQASVCCQHATISPKSTILQTLRWCQDIWTSKLAQSFCQSKVRDIIGRIITTVEVEL
ncbi:hypothetical protein LOZ65_001902 [Ophidiomyces ophidiicola]|nr:hypothetical protein LOZ65_001902 [Ophidiomyces ophidiicola]